MLSICTTIKNRSRVVAGDRTLELFPRCVESVRTALDLIPESELVVADWMSTDWPLDEWISMKIRPVNLKLLTVEGSFNRGRGRNLAGNNAEGRALFFLDADCIVSREAIVRGLSYIAEGRAYFPIVYSFSDAAHSNGWWREYGFCNCFVSRELFEATGGWPEYEVWGKEDDHFFSKVEGLVEIVRENEPGLQHQWHPDDPIWKNKYSKQLPSIKQEFELAEKLRRLVIRLLPDGIPFVLLDESRLGYLDFGARQVTPFLEKDGEYHGIPGDSKTAVDQLFKMMQKGIGFVVVSWICFWWLDYFPELKHFFDCRFEVRHRDDLAYIFEIKRTKPDAVGEKGGA